ncbi:hypothetical protein [Rheinheimera maricola]|uniref:Uncharacterized protein n=1 Tax=Rheinheimera maricola TaxID=2793282 RepID=A0ABS7XFF3_9GAMM|nr:hypothetical protein [Rheinheimera maricola]MBZ9613785.1 hypothetical protein [Rheinheimera maricola]
MNDTTKHGICDAHAIKILRNPFNRTVLFSVTIAFALLPWVFPINNIGLLLGTCLCAAVWIKSKTLSFLFSKNRYFFKTFLVLHGIIIVFICISAFFGYKFMYIFVLIAMIFYNVILADVWRELQVQYSVDENDLFHKD